MAVKNRPYEQFGSYILFKLLEEDALGELWRAGRIDGAQLGAAVALRRFTRGNRDALVAAADGARQVVPLLNGTSFARDQVIDIINGVPTVAHDYADGRSLRHIVDRARGGRGVTPNPIPFDLAIVIAERVALSVATTAEMKYDDKRLSHGALIPQFVWISDDGEIRVAGQQMGPGIVSSLKDPKIAADYAPYFAPHSSVSAEAAKTADVYSLGAILFLAVTGQEPPDPANANAFLSSVRGAKTFSGAAIPEDVREILAKSLAIDPANRYQNVGEMKQALSTLTHSGKYSATTFNLAFYLSTLLKIEMEGEVLDREKEMRIPVARYLEEAPSPATADDPPRAPAFNSVATPRRSRRPLAIAVGALALAGAAAWVILADREDRQLPATAPTSTISTSSPTPAVVATSVVPEPVIASPTVPAVTTSAPTVDTMAQTKAFEDAVGQAMQAEMLKLQAEHMKLRQEQAPNAPVRTAAPSAAQAGTRAGELSAAQLDQQRRDASRQDQPGAAPVATSTSVPAQAQTQTTVPVTATTAAREIREGDVVDVSELDSVPRPIAAIRAEYPPTAIRTRKQGTVLLTALISESGQVLEVRVLRKVGFGLDEAAVRALRGARFTSPMKSGRRVKTWLPQPIEFRL